MMERVTRLRLRECPAAGEGPGFLVGPEHVKRHEHPATHHGARRADDVGLVVEAGPFRRQAVAALHAWDEAPGAHRAEDVKGGCSGHVDSSEFSLVRASTVTGSAGSAAPPR